MDPLDYLTVRFHYRGDFEHDGKDWTYVGGKSGLSTIEFSKLSVSELKKNLADHVICSDKALENSTLHWKYPGGDMGSALLVLNDQVSVEMMAKHVIDAGVMDIYAVIPADESHEGNDWQFEFAEEFEAMHRGQDQSEEMQAEQSHAEQVHTKEVQTERRNTEEIQCRAKIPVYSDYVVPPAESNSFAEDEEILEYRKYAKEFKEKKRKKMLGEEEAQACNVTDDFIIPETCKLDDDADDTPCIASN